MEQITPSEYLETLKELLKSEVDKIENFKYHVIEQNKYEVASQFRDIQKKLLDFVGKLQA